MALTYADAIRDMGLIPFVPHLYHFWDKQFPHSYQYWTALDIAWLQKCDALYRIPGESKGADGEVKLMRYLGKPVFTSIHDLQDYASTATAIPVPAQD